MDHDYCTAMDTGDITETPGEPLLEHHVKALKCNDLANLLSRLMDIDDYGEDIQKLKENRINGKVFLTLPDNQRLLDKLDLSVGGEEEMRSVVKSLKESSSDYFSDASNDDQDSEHSFLLEPNMPWCSTGPPSPTATALDTLDADSEMQSGFVPLDAVWPWMNYHELRVQFLDPIPAGWTVGNGAQMNKENILAWANLWSQKGDGLIPHFVEAKPKEEAQIRVKFNSCRFCNSVLGMRAKNVPINEQTMNLDLHQGGHISDEFKKHLVIHEFGHALGLGHEHQRSNFWTCIRRFTDVKKMKNDLKVTDERFEQDWGELVNSETGHRTSYDPESVMHYWFKKEWLTSRYRKKEDILKDRKNKKLSAKEADALLGVHKRHHDVAKEPSPLDLKLMKELYGGVAMTTAAPPMASLSLGVLSVDGGRVMSDSDAFHQNVVPNTCTCRLGIKDLVVVKNELWSARTHWRQIGENLGKHPEDLEAIKISQRDDPGACLREVISQWLRRSSTPENPITWAALVSALQQGPLKEDCGRLAQDIEGKYLCGN